MRRIHWGTAVMAALLLAASLLSGCGKQEPAQEQKPEKSDFPVSFNTALLYNAQHSSYDEKAEQRRQEILAMPDTVKPSETGKTYYISYKGNDQNDGLSAEKAWRSSARLGMVADTLSEGDVVLFERGGLYRGAFVLTSGVTYGAYGEGCKPNIYGSQRDYAFPELWTASKEEGVWEMKVDNLNDIGNIVFNHGEKCGTKKLKNKLMKNGDFYHDTDNAILYLYNEDGNPGSAYYDMEFCSNENLLAGYANTHDVTIENLCLKYTGAHGIGFSTNSKNITVTGCEIGYIGGSMLGSANVRYGNGFEVVDNCDTITVRDNWIYQCFDAGMTHQSSYEPGSVQKNIRFSDNLVEYCTYNIEYYVSTTNGTISDTVYENNILRFAGCGFGALNRIGSNTSMSANICNYARSMPSSNFVIRNNVLDSPEFFQMTVGCPNEETGTKGPEVSGNTFIQKKSGVGIYLQDGSIRRTVYAAELNELKTALTHFDKSPASVTYE